jgi:large subunit ribosomal protein L15
MKHKRTKSSRHHGSRSHGFGSINRRGKGNKGGCGNAGSGKRADCKKPSYWKLPEGRNGFVIKGIYPKINAINLQRVLELIENGKLKADNGTYDIGSLGYNKLIGKGKIKQKINIKVERASEGVKECIQSAGGSLIIAE